jgi:hypothetical protein
MTGSAHGRRPIALSPSTFVPLLPGLTPWSPPGATEEDQIAALHRLADSMLEPFTAAQDPARDNPFLPAGYTYFGQFVDHDITFRSTATESSRVNLRTPALDLDSLYGRGPEESPYLFDSVDPWRLLLGKGRRIDDATFEISMSSLPLTSEDDLPRNEQGIALIGDPRNDETILISQVHLTFIKFHNAVLDRVRNNEHLSGGADFLRARELVRWHYQWIVLHDFLPRLAGAELVRELLDQAANRSLPWPLRRGQIPLEFAGAAFRIGHSIVRPGYHLNRQLRANLAGAPLPILLPHPASLRQDLRGRHPLPETWSLQWDMFLSIGGSTPQPSRRIDTFVSPHLASIPPSGNSLPFLNLLRGWKLGLPSGQAAARAVGIDLVHTNADLGLDAGFGTEAPLWYYILKEADLETGGARLGRLGASIVAQTLIHLVNGDPDSFLNAGAPWEPELGGAGGTFSLADLVEFAGVAQPPFPMQEDSHDSSPA